MQGPTGEAEPIPPEPERTFEDIYIEAAIWIVRLGAIIYLLSLFTVLLNDDEVRLHILHSMMRIFQTLARTFGSWALQTENAYNEYVSILH